MTGLSSRTTRRWPGTVFVLAAAVLDFASGWAGEDASDFFVVMWWALGIVAVVRLGSRFGMMGGGFEIGCKMFFCTVISLVVWMVAHGESPGLSIWPFIVAGVLPIPVLLSFLLLGRALAGAVPYLCLVLDFLIDSIDSSLFFVTVGVGIWALAQGLWPEIPMWPFVLTGFLFMPAVNIVDCVVGFFASSTRSGAERDDPR